MGDKCCITFMSPEGFPKCAAVVMSLSLGRFEISWLPISALAESWLWWSWREEWRWGWAKHVGAW